jgi:hypothetical protein
MRRIGSISGIARTTSVFCMTMLSAILAGTAAAQKVERYDLISAGGRGSSADNVIAVSLGQTGLDGTMVGQGFRLLGGIAYPLGTTGTGSGPTFAGNPVPSNDPVVLGANNTIRVVVRDSPTQVALFTRPIGGAAYVSVQMTAAGADTFVATIPAARITPSGLEYYIGAQNANGQSTLPATNPADNPFTLATSGNFTATQTTGKRVHRMFGTPLQLDPTGVTQVLGDDLGELTAESWRIGRFDPANNRYTEGAGVGPLSAGVGFWLITDQNKGIDANGRSLTPGIEGGVEITLLPGWNQIGHPFGFGVRWQDFLVRIDAQTVPVGSAENTVVENRLVDYDGSYRNATVALAWHGYWVRNISNPPANVRLVVPTTPVRQGKTDGAGGALALEPGTLRLRFEAGDQMDEVVAGIRAGTAAGPDRADWTEPPAPPAPFVDAWFDLASAGAPAGERYMTDLRPGIGDGETWRLKVRGTAAATPLVITVDGIGALDGAGSAALIDVASGATFDLAAEQRAALPVAADGAWERELRLVL